MGGLATAALVAALVTGLSPSVAASAAGASGRRSPVPVAHAPVPVTKAQSQSRQGILPPAEPPANIAPSPNFLADCSGSSYDDSQGCLNAVVGAIDNGREDEGLPGMVLPTDWAQLTPQEQLFAATNLERTVRGLPPLTAMASALDQASQAAAARNDDPSPPSGFPWTQWGGNWAGAVGNPLEAIYYWMY
ncbi:MAG: hypothetical protein ABSG81_10285, partial [Acidimicrobiales bacterium]